ncbi:MAG: hypothetical protein JW909_06780 [Planctomycetes bacterium]|nr:hypothetical protein [Planctomycetota bacterium]
MRPELKKIISELDELEAGLKAAGPESAAVNKIDDFFRMLLIGDNNYVASYLSQLKEGDDWILFNDVVAALEAGGFFDVFPKKKWIIHMVRGSWDKALREAREEMETPARKKRGKKS